MDQKLTFKEEEQLELCEELELMAMRRGMDVLRVQVDVCGFYLAAYYPNKQDGKYGLFDMYKFKGMFTTPQEAHRALIEEVFERNWYNGLEKTVM